MVAGPTNSGKLMGVAAGSAFRQRHSDRTDVSAPEAAFLLATNILLQPHGDYMLIRERARSVAENT
jgi:hypothetical protein